MKFQRTAMLLAALILCLVTGAQAADYQASGFFSLSYDDALILDDQSHQDENTSEANRWFFLLYNDAYTIDAKAIQLEDYEGFSLHSATEDERQAYLDDTIDLLSDEYATYLEMIEAGESGVPFYLFQMEDADGPYLLAETISNGYAIDFIASYNDNALADEMLAEKLTTLLGTYVPAA